MGRDIPLGLNVHLRPRASTRRSDDRGDRAWRGYGAMMANDRRPTIAVIFWLAYEGFDNP
jgi:hypothetical protein